MVRDIAKMIEGERESAREEGGIEKVREDRERETMEKKVREDREGAGIVTLAGSNRKRLGR